VSADHQWWGTPKPADRRALTGHEMQRTQVCKTEDEVFTTSEAWRTEAETKGWT